MSLQFEIKPKQLLAFEKGQKECFIDRLYQSLVDNIGSDIVRSYEIEYPIILNWVEFCLRDFRIYYETSIEDLLIYAYKWKIRVEGGDNLSNEVRLILLDPSRSEIVKIEEVFSLCLIN
jgi:hypothetical protein